MSAGTATSSWSAVPKASCCVAVLSTLPILWLFLFVNPNDSVGPQAFCLSVSLAVVGLILGVTGLFTARPYGYSVTGIILSGVILLFWAGLLLMAVLINMIALP